MMKMNLLRGIVGAAVVMTMFVGCGSNIPEVESEPVKREEQAVEKEEEFSYLGIWDATQVEIDGATFSIDEAEAMGEDYYSELHIVFKDGGKAVVIDDGYSDVVDWSENNGWLRIGDDSAQLEDGKIVMEQYGDKVFFEKQSDSQDVTDVVMRDNSEREITLEATNEYLEVTDIDVSGLEQEDGMVSGDLVYTIHVTQSYIDTYSKYDNFEIKISFYDSKGNLIDEDSIYDYLKHEKEYSSEESATVAVFTEKEVSEVKVDKIVVSR